MIMTDGFRQEPAGHNFFTPGGVYTKCKGVYNKCCICAALCAANRTEKEQRRRMEQKRTAPRAQKTQPLTYREWKRRKQLRLARNWGLFLAGCALVVFLLTKGILWLLPHLHGADDAQTAAIRDALLAELTAIDRAPLPLVENMATPRQEPVHKTETFDMVQAKLCMLFTLGQPMQPRQLAAVRLAMALYGGSVTSRQFLNVRERDHLCYYCSASFQSFTGSMAVNSGVEHADAARAEQAILKELAGLCDGPITDEELEDCRRGLLSGMNGVEDSLGGMETWYYIEVLRAGANSAAPIQTPAQARTALQAVTKEDVRSILRQLTLSVSYLLTKEEPTHA